MRILLRLHFDSKASNFCSTLSYLTQRPMCLRSYPCTMVCRTVNLRIRYLPIVSVRRALIEAPENVATLIRVMSSRLFNLVSDHTFPTPPTGASVTSFASSFIRSSTGTQGRSATKEVLNCLRVLQRVLPVVLDIDADATRLEMEIFWRKAAAPEGRVVSEETSQPQFVIEDDEDDGDEQETTSRSSGPSAASASQPKTAKTLPSMAERLFSCLIDLLFCCGFTLPTKIQVDHYKINYTIWYVALFTGLACRFMTLQGERRRLHGGSRTQPAIRK